MNYDFILNFRNDRIIYSRVSEEEYDEVYEELKRQHPQVSISINEHIPNEFERRFGI